MLTIYHDLVKFLWTIKRYSYDSLEKMEIILGLIISETKNLSFSYLKIFRTFYNLLTGYLMKRWIINISITTRRLSKMVEKFMVSTSTLIIWLVIVLKKLNHFELLSFTPLLELWVGIELNFSSMNRICGFVQFFFWFV